MIRDRSSIIGPTSQAAISTTMDGPTVEVMEDTPLLVSRIPIYKIGTDQGVSVTSGSDVPKPKGKLVYFCQFSVFISLAILVLSETLHYINLWSIPHGSTEPVGIDYPKLLIGCICSLSMGMFVLSSGFWIFARQPEHKLVWLLAVIGGVSAIVSFCIVVYKIEYFTEVQLYGKFDLSATFAAVYAFSALAIVLLVASFGILDIFPNSHSSGSYYKLLVLIGLCTFQTSLLVSIHSVVVQVGFFLFLTGILITTFGYLMGLRASSSKGNMKDRFDV